MLLNSGHKTTKRRKADYYLGIPAAAAAIVISLVNGHYSAAVLGVRCTLFLFERIRPKIGSDNISRASDPEAAEVALPIWFNTAVA